MALHGDLKFNGITIGLYSIRRTDKPHPFKKAGWLVYDWEYARTGDLTKRYKGSVTHLPSNGAEELVAKVMTKIKTTLRKT